MQKTHCKNTGTCANHFPVKPLLEQQKRIPKFDSHTGIMQILEISFQYYHICKYLLGSSFQALNFTKQEALTKTSLLHFNCFGLISLNPPLTGVRGQPGPYLACEFNVVVPVKHKIQGSINSKLLENFKDSGPYSPLKNYVDNT